MCGCVCVCLCMMSAHLMIFKLLNWCRGEPAHEMGNEVKGGTIFGTSLGVL